MAVCNLDSRKPHRFILANN